MLGAEGAGVLFFIEQLDAAHPNAVVIEIELLGIVDRVTEFDLLADIRGRDLVEGALEADGGIVIDDPVVRLRRT